MWLGTLKIEIKLQKFIRMGITIFQFLFGEVYCRIYVQKSRFKAPNSLNFAKLEALLES